MRILLTGANGYIGSRLLIRLIEDNHTVIALMRTPARMDLPESMRSRIQMIKGDLLDPSSLHQIPHDIDAAYYLVHSMGDTSKDFVQMEKQSAENFIKAIEQTKCQQIIYLTGLISSEHLSKHLASRLQVENILKKSRIPYTVLRAGIIIGSGSASFEIIRDLVEKLPIMVAPRWVSNLCEPIAIRDVIDYLARVLDNKKCLNQVFDIGNHQQLTYRQLLLGFAKKRKMHRLIIPVPFFSPKLSSYWLFFITSTTFSLAQTLVDSLKCDAICQNRAIDSIIEKKCLTYDEALKLAFDKVESKSVVSSWRDAISSGKNNPHLFDLIEVPSFGCQYYRVHFQFEGDPHSVFDSVLTLGGKNGYYMDFIWRIRGLIDRYLGGAGLNRGKTERKHPRAGDAIDFWRVLLVDEKHLRFLLFAEMKMPGEGWLDFKIEDHTLIQTATFRPKGVLGRLYWIFLAPFHALIFKGLGKKLIKQSKSDLIKILKKD
ncbi:MAG: SDR family oxidoreductase [Simkaniaceae bacterium]|nr:SDR family oxidoreductase [Simkaniaceae bacterium]MCF7852592.1 SDR family oxidoreductase [Simkaniaceae bacterium]